RRPTDRASLHDDPGGLTLMKRVAVGLLSVSLLVGWGVAGTAGAGPTRHDTGTGNTTCNTDPNLSTDVGSLSWSPTTLWPPNGKLVPVTIKFTPSSEDSSETNWL